jgi:hypothetical protein
LETKKCRSCPWQPAFDLCWKQHQRPTGVKVPEEIRHVGALWAIASKGRLEGMGCIWLYIIESRGLSERRLSKKVAAFKYYF